jgi:hypothetical protein
MQKLTCKDKIRIYKYIVSNMCTWFYFANNPAAFVMHTQVSLELSKVFFLSMNEDHMRRTVDLFMVGNHRSIEQVSLRTKV